MPKLSWCIVLYGALLISCDLVDANTSLPIGLRSSMVVPLWGIGVLAIASGIASAQRRRSLRLTGTILGLLIPLFVSLCGMGCAFGAWRQGSAGYGLRCSLAGGLSLLSLATCLLILGLRDKEGIASRGYSVPISSPRNKPLDGSSSPARQRSEAG